MGQRHQVIVIFPEVTYQPDNPNNRPVRAEVIHHQWYYGRTAILGLARMLKMILNAWDGAGPDYLFGRSNVAPFDGVHALAAAMGCDPETGYFHRTHVWEPADWNGAVKANRQTYSGKVILPSKLHPDMFDNNDGCTLLYLYPRERVPGYAFLTPGHLEGEHWTPQHGRGPWTAREYLAFYYATPEQAGWSRRVQAAMRRAFAYIEQNAKVMERSEVTATLPLFFR